MPVIESKDMGSFVDGISDNGDVWEACTWDKRCLGLADFRLPNGDQYALARSLRVYGNGKVGVPAQLYYWVFSTTFDDYRSFPTLLSAMTFIAERMERVMA